MNPTLKMITVQFIGETVTVGSSIVTVDDMTFNAEKVYSVNVEVLGDAADEL